MLVPSDTASVSSARSMRGGASTSRAGSARTRRLACLSRLPPSPVPLCDVVLACARLFEGEGLRLTGACSVSYGRRSFQPAPALRCLPLTLCQGSPRDADLPRQRPLPPAGVFRERLPAASSRRLQVSPSPGSGRPLPHAGLSSQRQLTVSTGNNFVLKSTHESSTWSMSAYICCSLPPGSHEAEGPSVEAPAGPWLQDGTVYGRVPVRSTPPLCPECRGGGWASASPGL
ncbi:uncharacterized protein LOC130680174 [Manis pentadactyla]|uniref:uncharacterized protein LOC130680174 n=1 Tax=Manis pentadactyla TaxID=143292 RepID=UPI00255CE807|nr:uncharacterized protein LOC130680174 [Manis pentadactyla]